jgi:hypothetical protein
VRYPADFLRKYLDSLILNLTKGFLVILFLDSLILNLTKGKERYVELLDETLKKELQENFQISTYRVIFPIH